MAKIKEISFEIPSLDGSIETQKIPLNYKNDEQKFSLKVPDHIRSHLGVEPTIQRNSEKETRKHFQKLLDRYDEERHVETEKFIVIRYSLEFDHPKGFRVDAPGGFMWGCASEDKETHSEHRFDYCIYTKRGDTWFDEQGEKLRHFNDQEDGKTWHPIIPWTQERQDALDSIRGDFNIILAKLMRYFMKLAKDPDLLLGQSFTLTGARRIPTKGGPNGKG